MINLNSEKFTPRRYVFIVFSKEKQKTKPEKKVEKGIKIIMIAPKKKRVSLHFFAFFMIRGCGTILKNY
jgi:hypothetical protein